MQKLHHIFEESLVLAHYAPRILLVQHFLVQFYERQILDRIQIYDVAIDTFIQISLLRVNSELGNPNLVQTSYANNQLPYLLMTVDLDNVARIFVLQLNFDVQILLRVILLDIFQFDMLVIKFTNESLNETYLI